MTNSIFLKNYMELNTEWQNFVKSIEQLSKDIVKPFSIFMPVIPIRNTIADGILYYLVMNSIEKHEIL